MRPLVLAAIFLTIAPALFGAAHKIRVTDRALADALVAQGGKVLADYKSFQVLEVDQTPDTRKLGGRVELLDQADSIELNAATLNTRAPEVQMQRASRGAFAGKRLHLVQFVGPIKPEWRAALERTGAKIVHYVPNNAYLVYGDAAALARLQLWSASDATVQWDGEYGSVYKVHPRARSTDVKGQPRSIGTSLFTIQMVKDPAANPATLQLIDQLKLEPILKTADVLAYQNVTVSLSPVQLDLIAAQPDVVAIHPYFLPQKRDERQDQIVAGNLSGNLPSGPGYLDWLASKGFTQAQFDASGFVVDVSDSGIDNGTLAPGHFAFYPLADVTTNSRVVYSRFERTVVRTGATLRGCDGHGNLNAHIIGGYDAFTGGFPHTDSAGFNYGLGVCPFVKLGCSVVFDNFDPTGTKNDFTSPDYPTLLTDAYNSDARISNNSWGGDVAGDYDSDAQQYDTLVRDVGGGADGREMVVVFVAGNAGPTSGATTLGIDSPGSAKNVLTIGALENVRSLNTANGGSSSLGNDGCSTPDGEADSANDIEGFSSQGPCADGRTKPDLLTPGTHITGGVPQAGAPTTNGIGNAISCFTGTGVCALPGSGSVGSANNFFPLNQKFYTESSGTSHAGPAAAGACALLRQYFINQSNPPPSPAMTKAYLMNSARYVTGQYAGDTLPSPSQGMGALNLGTAFDGVPRVLRDQESADVMTASGQTRTFTGFINSSAKPFHVTLAWTDAAGGIFASKALVNDLDLTVTVGGQTYKGNVFNGSVSQTGGAHDSLNNVESVFLPAGISGPFTITVSAANISADGIANGASANQQDFALVVYNASLTPTPAVVISDYALSAEDCSPANGTIDPGETVTVNFTFQNLGTADTTSLQVSLLQTNSVVNPSASQNLGDLVANGPAVTVPFVFTAGGSCGGTITPTFALTDGHKDLGTVSVTIPLGTLAPIYLQSFDRSPAPALPPWWTTTRSNGQSLWVVSKNKSDSSPNAAYSAESASAGVNALNSPVLQMPTGGAQLIFRNNYNTEGGYDGGVLEIKIGDGAFTDILAAGGSFVSGGYNSTLRSSANPLSGRSAWSGSSGGFITTAVNLPVTVSGQPIQLRWRLGTDAGNGVTVTGWYVDSVEIDSYVCCPSSTPTAPFMPSSGAYNGLFYETNGIQVRSSGMFSASVDGRGAFSGTLLTGASKLAIKGLFGPFGTVSTNVSRGSGLTPLQLLMQLDTADNGRITGSVSDGNWTAALYAERSRWDSKTNVAPLAGSYTFILPGPGNSSDTTQPQGNSYGTIAISSSGAATLSGVLADSIVKITPASKLSDFQRVPFYSSLYSGKGQILGWLNFSNAEPNLSGSFDWIKPTNATKFYPLGFEVQSNAIGSAYHSPGTGNALLNFANGTAIFIGGNYFGTVSNTGTNSPSAKLVYKGTNGLAITLNSPSVGLFKGTVMYDPVARKSVSFGGAVLQTQQMASGFLLGTNQIGKVTFGP